MSSVRSVELLLDSQGDSRVRDAWRALTDAGLPSLDGHPSPTNRPHVTLAAGAGMTVAPSLAPVALPEVAEFGGLLLFPRRSGWVVARAVVVTAELLATHAEVHRHLAGAAANTLPGHWSPHVTLSRRMPNGQIEAALDALRAVAFEDAPGAFAGARLWDAETRTTTELSIA